MASNQSEIASLLQQIEAEYTAAMSGLSGLAIAARHKAITARMENLGKLHEDLHALVGDEAIRLFAQQLDLLPDISNDCEGSTISPERMTRP